MPSEAGEEQEMLDLEVLTGRRRPASQRWPWTERPPSQKGICSVFFFFLQRILNGTSYTLFSSSLNFFEASPVYVCVSICKQSINTWFLL